MTDLAHVDDNNNRAEAIENALAITEALYATSAKLNQASELEEVLEAIAAPAIKTGAVSAGLFTFDPVNPTDPVTSPGDQETNTSHTDHNESQYPKWCTLAARWAVDPSTLTLGTRLYLPEFPLSDLWFQNPNAPILVENVETDERIGETLLAFLKQTNVKALILLLLRLGPRWIGFIVIRWKAPHQFQASDERFYQSLAQQAAIVIDNRLLFENLQTHTQELEKLASVQTRLSQAASEEEILSAVAAVFDSTYELTLTLAYIDFDEQNNPETLSTVAVWKNGLVQADDPGLYQKINLEQISLLDLWTNNANQVRFISEPERSLEASVLQALVNGTRCQTMALMPLRSGGRWQGLIALIWAKSHPFSSSEQVILQRLLETAGTIVASHRSELVQQIALAETEILYQTSRRLNEANDLAEIVAALAESLPISGINRILLLLSERSTSGEVIAVRVAATWYGGIGTPPAPLETRYARTDPQAIDLFFDINTPVFVENVEAVQANRLSLRDRDVLIAQHVRSLALYPLQVGALPLGVLVLQGESPHQFAASEIKLYSSIFPQVAVAVDNKRLFRQTRERTVKLQSASDISQEFAAILDLDQLLKTVVRAIRNTFGYYAVQIYLLDASKQTLVLRESSRADDQRIEHRVRLEAEQSLVSQAAYALEPVFVNDLGQTPSPKSQEPGLEEVRSEVAIPLSFGDELLGVLDVQHDIPGQFDPDEIRTLLIIANQLSVNLTNAQLFDQTQRTLLAQEEARAESDLRAQELAILNELAQNLSSGLSLHDILEAAYQGVTKLFEATDFYVALYSEDTDRVSFPLYVEAGGADWETPSRVAGHELTDHVIRTKSSLLINEDMPAVLEELTFDITNQTVKSWLGVPLSIGPAVIGMLALQNFEHTHAYTEHDRDLLDAVANLTAIAVQNAQQFVEAQRLARRERLLYIMSAEMRKSINPDTIVKIGLETLGRELDKAGIRVHLNTRIDRS